MKNRPYFGRTIQELAALPDSAPITPRELCEFQRISPSEYYRRRAAGRIPDPVRLGPQTLRHVMSDARSPFEACR